MAVVLCLNLTLGLVTTPVGTGLFTASLLTGFRAECIAFILMPFRAKLAVKPVLATIQEVGTLLLQCMCGCFGCSTALSKPDVECAMANGYRSLLAQSQDHLVQRDVLCLFIHVDHEARMGIEARASASPLFCGR